MNDLEDVQYVVERVDGTVEPVEAEWSTARVGDVTWRVPVFPGGVTLGVGDTLRPKSPNDRRRDDTLWVLVERYVVGVQRLSWRLVFRRGDEVLEVSVAEEVWRAFDR